MTEPTIKNFADQQDPLAQLLAESTRCVKCGRCLSVCPVYKETGREPGVARGKLSLIESIASGKMSPTSRKKLQEIISFCLLCGSCAENCPNLVPSDTIIQKAREVLISKGDQPLTFRFFLSHILPFPKRMDDMHKGGRKLQPLFLKNVPSESGLHWRFPLLGDQRHRVIPCLANEPFLKKHPQKEPSEEPACTLFIGCVSNYLFPPIAEAVLGIFKSLNISVSIPPGQACCGLMAFGTGVAEVDRKLAQKNIEAFEATGSSPVVAFCSSCSSHLKNYRDLFEEKEWRSRALAFSQRVKDLSEFLIETGFEAKAESKAIKPSYRLTFHDPCHLRRKQGIFDQPRLLLKSLKEIEFVETGEENLCCGSGGSFSLSHYPVSRKIFSRRLRSIEQAGVGTVVTSCMGCLLQFLDGLYQEGKPIRVKHLAEVLREGLPR